MRKRLGLFILYMGILATSHAQEIKINNVILSGGEVQLYYNLIDERIDRSYSVSLYSSKDNFIQPMEFVSGDVGIDIPVGENKVVVWDALSELGEDFDKGISLELKGNYYIPFITLDGLESGKIFKRGKANDLAWSGGRGDNILNFELYKGDNLVKSFEERPNNGNTSITFPIKVRPGKDYRFRISDSNNRDEVVFSEPFIIKRKIPLGAQLGISFALGVGIGYLIYALLPEEQTERPDISLPALPE